MAANYFEDLEIWKEARRLTNRIYAITHKQSFSKDYGLCDQIRRASVSVMSNIAEGFERSGNQEFIQFLSIAKGSCGEVRAQLYIALDQKYISTEESDRLINDLRKLSIMIHHFMNYLKTAPYKGTKYKQPKQKSMKEEIEELLEEVHAQKGI
jgi:four helix bundle protein